MTEIGERIPEMKIAIVCDVLGSENNGTTIAAMNLIRHLQAAGHEVRVLCADQDKKGQKNTYVAPNRSFGKLLDAYVHKIGVTLSKKDEKLVAEALDGVEFIHSMLPFALGKQAAKYAVEHGIPMTAGFHMQAENLTSYLKVNKLKLLNKMVYKNIYSKFYRYVDGIHYPTAFIRGIFERSVKKTTRGYVISNGVNSMVEKRDVPKPAEFEGKIVISSTGRYATEKSQDTLIEAVNRSKYRESIQLILAGQGVKERYFRKLARKLPIPPVFKLFPRDEICDVINYSDIYVHPAQIELEGIACLEAIMCGKLTIVSDSELSATKAFALDEKCIFRKRDPKDLARVIDYWIEHPDERREYEKKYAESANIFRQEECMRRMEEMMLDVLAREKDKKPCSLKEKKRQTR